jgi:hypothetical protein
VRDGRVVGRWRRTVGDVAATVGLDRRVQLTDEEERSLEAAVDRYAAFLGRPVSVATFD